MANDLTQQGQAGPMARMKTPAARQFLKTSDLLLTWTPAEQVPAEAKNHIEGAISFALESLHPARAETWAVVLDGFIGWIERFGVIPLPPVDSPERSKVLGGIIKSYRDALGDIPDDLLQEAFEKTIKLHEYRNLPLPAQVRKHIEDEFRDRKRRCDKLNTASFMLKHRPIVESEQIERVRPTDEQKEMVRKINDITRATLAKID